MNQILAIIQSLTYEENKTEITKAFKGENYDPDNDLDNLVKSKDARHVYNLEDAKIILVPLMKKL